MWYDLTLNILLSFNCAITICHALLPCNSGSNNLEVGQIAQVKGKIPLTLDTSLGLWGFQVIHTSDQGTMNLEASIAPSGLKMH